MVVVFEYGWIGLDTFLKPRSTNPLLTFVFYDTCCLNACNYYNRFPTALYFNLYINKLMVLLRSQYGIIIEYLNCYMEYF